MLRWLLHKNMLISTNANSINIIYEKNKEDLSEANSEEFFEKILSIIVKRNHPFAKDEKILQIRETILSHGRPKTLIDACAYYSAADIGIDVSDAEKFSYIKRRCRVELVKKGYRTNGD